ncbi:terpene synthase family protein [Lentzea sp. NPDC059081]|uniref:terpene synthase family protein n=1 Tax=Lentzea sp. NPDC059081 TaxID=3346719 RepID=UPI00367E679D
MTGLVMPHFPAPFPEERNPHLDEASAAMWDWVRATGLAPTAAAGERLRRSGADLSGAYIWPRAGLDELTLGLKWLALTFPLDDFLDEGGALSDVERRAVAVEGLVDLLHGRPSPVRGAAAEALASLWEETALGTTEQWRSAFVRDFSLFLRSYADDAKLTAQDRLPTLDDYLPKRMYSVGTPWLWDLDELRLPAVLPEPVRDCPVLHEVRTAGSLHIAMVNDVFSAPRERLTDYPHNAVFIVQRQFRCTVQAAVDHVAELVAEQVGVFESARERLLAKWEGQVDLAIVADYASNVAAGMRGQLSWHQAVERYEVDDLGADVPTHGYPDDLIVV